MATRHQLVVEPNEQRNNLSNKAFTIAVRRQGAEIRWELALLIL